MNYLLSFFISLQLSFINYATPVSENVDPIEHTLIDTYEKDLTNDGSKETVQLNGQLLSKQSNYYHKISVDIIKDELAQWNLTFPGGYEPQIEFLDLNQDGKSDLLYQSLKSNDEKKYDQHLYTFKNKQFIEIPLPKHHYIKGEFKDHFHVDIHLSPLKKQSSLTFSLNGLAEKYVDHGIYNSKGKKLKDVPLNIGPISFFNPIQVGKEKGYGLKSSQPLFGIDQLDHLGNLETTWYYDHDQWIILHIDVIQL